MLVRLKRLQRCLLLIILIVEIRIEKASEAISVLFPLKAEGLNNLIRICRCHLCFVSLGLLFHDFGWKLFAPVIVHGSIRLLVWGVAFG